MRFMVQLTGEPALGAQDDPSFIEAMRAYTDDLGKAGVMLAAEAVRPSRASTRIRFDRGGVRSVRDGPLEDDRPLGGFLLIQVRTKDEAIEWARRCPLDRTLSGGEEADIVVHELADEPPW